MGVLSQFVLLLWKNVLLRLRYPGIFVLEVLWPILIVGIIAIMRLGTPPFRIGNCHYQPRAMPSVGGVPFLQTYVCNLDNKCYISETQLENAELTTREFHSLTEELGPYLSDSDVLDVLNSSDKSVIVLTSLNDVVGDKELMHGLNDIVYVKSYFRDPQKVKEILVKDFSLMTNDQAQALLDSQLNVAQILNLTGTPELREIACDPIQLSSYINFPEGTDVNETSKALCDIKDDQVEDLTNKVIGQLNVTAVVNALKLFEDVKQKFGVPGLAAIFDSVAEMFEVVMSSESLIDVIGDFIGIPGISDLIRDIPKWIDQFSSFSAGVAGLQDMVNSLQPLMIQLEVDDSDAWLIVKNGVQMGIHFMELGDGKWNGTAQEFIKPMMDLTKNVENLMNGEEGKQMVAVLKFLSSVDWIRVYDTIIISGTLPESTIMGITESLQVMLEEMPERSMIMNMARIIEHILDMMSIFTEKSIVLRCELNKLFETNSDFQKEMNRVFQYSPVVAQALIEAMVDSKVLGDLLTKASSYETSCQLVVESIQTKVPADVYQSIYDSFCTGDVMAALSSLGDDVGMKEISDLINSTVAAIEALYEGEFFPDSVNLTQLYHKYNRFTTAINDYLYDDCTWEGIFDKMSSMSTDVNERGWEPVTDLLNEDFLSKGIVGIFQALGQNLASSSISNDLAPWVHMLSRLTKMIYDTLNDINSLYSKDSPLIKLANLVTSYLPEIVQGLNIVFENDMDAVYNLISSSDPLDTFCIGNYIEKLRFPPEVPVSEMNTLICNTTWTEIIDDLSRSVPDVENMISEMENLLSFSSSDTYDVEKDWIDMTDYSERIIDVILAGDYIGFDTSAGSVALFSQLDLSRVEEALNLVGQLLEDVAEEDIEKWVLLAVQVMEKTNTEEEVQQYLALYDVLLDLQIDTLEQYQRTPSLQSILDDFPKDLTKMTTLLAKAYPQFVRALRDIILDPQKFVEKLIKDGFHLPDCKTHMLSDYTALPPTSAVHSFERFLCDLDMEKFLEELMDSQQEATTFVERLTEILNGTKTNFAVNTSQLVAKTQEYIDLLNPTMTDTDFDLSPFNLTAIDLSWQQFYDAARTLENVDDGRIAQLIVGAGQMSLGFLDDLFQANSSLSMMYHLFTYIGYQFNLMLQKEAVYFESSSEVILFDYLGSSELNKLRDVLLRSPEINAVGVATLDRLFTSPEKAEFEIDFDKLCTNVTRFSEVFVVSAGAPVSPETLQKTVCGLNISLDLVLEQVSENRPGIKEFIDAMDVLSRPLTVEALRVNISETVDSFTKLNDLITSISTNPPTIKLTSDESWMEMSKYTKAWENLGSHVDDFMKQNLDNPGSENLDWQSVVRSVLAEIIKEMPDLQGLLNYMDAILDLMDQQLQQNIDGIGGLRKYPNANKLIDLMNKGPEAVQTMLYTILTQQEQVAKWTNALESWSSFCNTSVDQIMTVPPSLKASFSMSDFIASTCSIDFDELIQELMKYGSIDRLETLFSNETSAVPVNESTLIEKIEKVVKGFEDLEDGSTMDTESGYLRLFDPKAWEDVGRRIESWSNETMQTDLSPDNLGILVAGAFKSFTGMSNETQFIYDQALGIADILLDQALILLNANSLNEAFRDLPSMQVMAGLLNELPELFETIQYTSILHPEKVTERINKLSSFESFCETDPEKMFTVAPGSNFNLTHFLDRLCSINIDHLIDELSNFGAVKSIENIVNETHHTSANMSSIIEKADKVISKLSEGFDVNERVFDSNVWQKVFDRIDSWIWPGSVENFLQRQQTSFARGLIMYLENYPGSEDMLRYIGAILDIIDTRIEDSKESLPETVKDFPTLRSIVELLEQAPEMIETALYTVLTQPDQTSAWSSALQSFDAFCGTPVSNIMTSPPGSGFNVTAYLAKLCSVDIDVLGSEFTKYDGADRISQIMSGNDNSSINATALMERLDQVLDSLGGYYTDPLSNAVVRLRLFNETVWEKIGKRIESWSEDSTDDYSSPTGLSNIFTELYGSLVSQSPELKEAFDKAVAITDVLMDEILAVINASTVEEAVAGVPSLEKILQLADHVPELYEVLVYTSLMHPEKVRARAKALVTLDQFCSSKPEDIFSQPPDMTFDIGNWMFDLCSLNLTQLETDIENFKLVKEIDRIVTEDSTKQANLTSVMQKLENLMKRVDEGVTLTDRFLNESIWMKITNKVETWAEGSPVSIPVASMDGIFMIMQTLQESQYDIKQGLQPLRVAGFFFSNLMDIAFTMENMTELGLSDFFQRWTPVHQLMNFIQMPNVLDVMVASLDSLDFEDEDLLKNLCDSQTPASKYLQSPTGRNVDLEKIRDTFCDIDFENFEDHFIHYFDYQRLLNVAEGTEDFNWGELSIKVSRLDKMINKWIEHPPSFSVPDNWLNETYWMDLLDLNVDSFEEQMDIKDQLENIINQLGPLLDMDGLKQVGIVLNNVLDILNENVVAMRSQTLTLGKAMDKIPGLQDLFGALGLDTDMMTSLIKAPIRNASALAELLLSDDLQKEFCTTDKWREIVDFPADFDTSGLNAAICKDDVEPLLQKLKHNFNLESMIDALSDNASHVEDWRQAVDKVYTLMDNIKDLIDHPPELLTDDVADGLSDTFTVDNLWNVLPALSVLQESFSNDTQIMQPLSSVFSAANVLVDFLDNILARLKLQNGRLDLASLFHDVPDFVKIVNSVLGLNPDPVTGLLAVQLKPEKVDDFIAMASDPDKLSSLFCSSSQFETIFSVAKGTNVSNLLTTLCNLDFEPIASKMSESFKIDTLEDELSAAMESGKPVDVEKLTEKIETMIERLTNLSTIEYLMFDNRDLGDLLSVNETRLLELLEGQGEGLEDTFTQDYAAMAADILNNLLSSLGTGADLEELTLALRFVKVYLHSFNSFLKSIKDKPISLVLLMNNTEVGHILNPILNDPNFLDGLMNTDVDVKQLEKLLESSSREDDLCGEQLFSALVIPPNEKQIAVDLQSRLCSTNETLLLWQTVMLQANGYWLYKQIDVIQEELNAGKNSLNVTGAADEMEEFINLMRYIISQYMDGTRSANNLLDVNGFKDVFEKAQTKIAQRLLDSVEKWSVDAAQSILPRILDNDTMLMLTQTMNTINLFMNLTLDHLQGIRSGEVSLSTLFTNADDFSNLIEAYIRLGKNLPQALVDGELDADKLDKLFSDGDRLSALCKQPEGVVKELTDQAQPSNTVKDMSTVICSVVGTRLTSDFQSFIDIDAVGKQLSEILNSSSIVPNYAVFSHNVREFINIVGDLANSSLSDSLQNTLNFDDMLDALTNIAEDPKMIFRLMKLLGLAIDPSLKESPEAIKILSGVNTFSIMPLMNVMEALKDKGLTLEYIFNHPDALIDVLSVAVDFNTHYSVIESFLIKSWVNDLAKMTDTLCNNESYEKDVWVRLEKLSLPMSWKDIQSMMCSTASSEWLQKLTEMGLTNIQRLMLIEQLTLNTDLSLLPEMYDQDFSWVKLMSNLEELTDLITFNGSNKAESVKSAWDTVKDIVFDKSLKSILSYLRIQEESSFQQEEWIRFKQFLQFCSSAVNFLNKNLDAFNGKNTLVKVEDILPDSNRIATLLNGIFGSTGAAEFLTTMVDPIMFFRMDEWEDMLCKNGASITDYFTFPPGADVSQIQKDLCQAVLSRSSNFEELLSLFSASDMLQELDKLINGKYNSSNDNTIWDDVHTSMMNFIQTVENLQHAQVDASSVTGWLTPILNTLESLGNSQNQQLSIMCQAMVKYLNNTEGYREGHLIISRAITALNLLTNMAELIPDLDDVTCTFVSNDKIDITGTVKALTDLGLFDDIRIAIEEFIEPSEKLDCSAPVSVNSRLMDVINLTLSSNSLDVNRLSSCLENTEEHFRTLITSVNDIIQLVNDLVTALRIPAVSRLMNNPDLLSVLQFIVDTANSNKKVILAVSDLLEDKDGAADHLLTVLGLPESVVDAFLNATVNDNWLYFFGEPIQTIQDILCDPSKLSQVISLPQDAGVNISEISTMLCGTGVKDTVDFLKNISSSTSTIQNLADPSEDTLDIVRDLVNEISKMIDRFSGVINLFINVLSEFDLNSLKNSADEIDDLLTGDTLEELSDSLQDILDNVEKLVDDEGMGKVIINDMKKIVDGIFGLDILSDAFVESVRVKDLVNDAKAILDYLTINLGMKPDVAQAIMDGSFSSRVFLGLENRTDYTCDEVLKMVLFINTTQSEVLSIRRAICELSTPELTDLVSALTKELDIGLLISKYINYAGESILESTNMTMEELGDMVEKIDRSSAILTKANDAIRNSPNGTNFLNIFSDPETSELRGMNDLIPTMCGSGVTDIFSPEFTPGVIISTTDDIASEIEEGIKDNLEDLPNKYCVEIYETIRQSSIGSILWAYLKPIIRGKILYTPDTPATRAILEKANSTFLLVEEVRRVAKIWAENTPNLMVMTDVASNTDDLKDALENNFIKGLVEATVGVSAESLISGLDALEANNFDTDQLKGLQKAASLLANYSSCIEVDRFQPIASEKELEVEAYRLSKSKLFLAGIVFTNAGEDGSGSKKRRRRRRQTQDIVPKHINYKIRMDVDNVMDTNRLKSSLWKMAAEDSFVEDMRYLRGFIHIQDMLDSAIIDIHKDPQYTTPGFRIRQMPFPCHHLDNFIFLLGSYLIPIMMTFVYLAALGTATHNLVYDRENGQETTLQVMGMISGINFIAWLLSTMLLMAGVNVILAIMLKYTDIFIYSNVFLIFLYLMDFCLSSLMLLYLVSSFFTRTTLAILFVLMIYLISYLPYILVVSLEVDMKGWQKSVACLASTTAFSFAAHNLAYLEESGTGLQWHNIADDVTKDFSIEWACIMMLIDSLIYLVIGWYVRNVMPGKYGVAQPLYFPILPSYWCGCFRSKGERNFSTIQSESGDSSGLFEVPPADLKVGISVENLSKTYKNKKKAVENLTATFYEGEITCLLGHNGAAKTTTMKMMCGILDPTSGRVFINEQQAGFCRHSLGICPQQNALFNYMSVIEHMEFYAGVKGVGHSPKRIAEIKKLLQDVDLWHARKTPVRDLSWGMKRRLCVALAFVGGSRTIVMDEPTSGVDPHARKNIWNIITKNRPGRTILLSTHHLDEADILSDRIAIMHQGKLLCCGSPAFLKRVLGGGFKLSIIKNELTDVNDDETPTIQVRELRSKSANEAIITYIRNMCPDAEIMEQVGTDLTITLPGGQEGMKVPFYQFFQQLDQFADQLQINSYGVSDTTLEEVFLNLTHKADVEADTGSENRVMTNRDRMMHLSFDDLAGPQKGFSSDEKFLFSPAARMHYEPNTDSKMGPLFDVPFETSVDVKKRHHSTALLLNRVFALFVKRFHHYRRNWRMVLSGIMLPLLGFLIAMAFSTIREDESKMSPLILDPAIYGPRTYTFYSDTAKNSRSSGYVSVLEDPNTGFGTACMRDYHSDDFSCVKPSSWYNHSTDYYLAACKNARQLYIDLHQKLVVQEKTVPSNQYLQNLGTKNIPSYILNTFRDYTDKRFGGWSFERETGSSRDSVEPYVWFNSKGYHAMPSFFNSMSNTVLRAQLPIGEEPSEYGITAINHPLRLSQAALTMKTLQNDAADAGIAIMVVLAFSFIPCGVFLYLINERNQKERQLQFLGGVSHFMYWAVALIWDLFVYAIAVGLAVVIVVIFQTDAFYIKDNLTAFSVLMLLYGWSIIPLMYSSMRIFGQGSTAYLVTFCLNLFLALATVISLLVMQLFRDTNAVWQAFKVCRYLYLIFPQYALGQGLMNLVSNTVKYKLFKRFGEEIYDDPFSKDVIGYHILALAISGFVFFVLTLIIEAYRAPPLSLPGHNETKGNQEEDEDVVRERERIKLGSNSDVLVVDDFSKVYRRGWKKFCAVNHISFGVPKGECFGLLGVNGAGKTTTFRMLTGDLLASGGGAALMGTRLVQGDFNVSQEVGYCPQEGGLDEYLTGEETLYFHARIRGFDSKQTKVLASELLKRLKLEPYAKKIVHTYSGGTRRKLALAVAMLGDPPILYLDEPTTGMDAGTRRLAWHCIAQANRNGQSVVLTSHSMDECDALCSRIAIMVNGHIKCIGSPQHLKTKFGDGYTVIMHTKKGNTSSITQSFLSRFPGAVIKARHNTSIEFQIPATLCHVAEILSSIQKAEEDGVIDYYSLSQTTLDSVFVNFAREQTDNYEDDVRSSLQSETDSKSETGSFSSSGALSSSDSASYPTKPPGSKYVFMNQGYAQDDGDVMFAPRGVQYASNPIYASEDIPPKSPISTRL